MILFKLALSPRNMVINLKLKMMVNLNGFYRPIAKFEIPIHNKNNIGEGFSRIPASKLYQENDNIKRLYQLVNRNP